MNPHESIILEGLYNSSLANLIEFEYSSLLVYQINILVKSRMSEDVQEDGENSNKIAQPCLNASDFEEWWIVRCPILQNVSASVPAVAHHEELVSEVFGQADPTWRNKMDFGGPWGFLPSSYRGHALSSPLDTGCAPGCATVSLPSLAEHQVWPPSRPALLNV